VVRRPRGGDFAGATSTSAWPTATSLVNGWPRTRPPTGSTRRPSPRRWLGVVLFAW